MHSPLGRMKNVAQSSNPGDIKNFTESGNDADCKLFETIYSKVTKKNHRHGSPQIGTDKTLKRCIDLFEEGANPKVLTQLEKVLEARQDEPTIAKHIQQSNQVNSPKTPDKLKESLKDKKENYSYYTQRFLPVLKEEIMKSEKLAKLLVFNKETEQSQGPKTRKGEIVGIILDITSRSKDKSHPSKKATEQINVAEENDDKEPAEETTVTPEFSNSGGSDSGVSSPELSEKSLESPASSSPISVTSTSSQESLDLTLSSAEEDENPQKEEAKSQVQPGQTVEQVKENENSDGRADRDIKDQVKEELQPDTLMTDGHRNPLESEGRNKENATVQKPSVSKNNKGSNKQPSPVKNMSADHFSKILEEIKKGDKDYSKQEVAGQGAPGKCKRAFKNGVDPEELLTELEKSVKENTEHRDNFTKYFLPALLKETLLSEELNSEKINEVLRVTSDIIKRSGDTEYERHIQFLKAWLERIQQGKVYKKKEEGKVKEIVGTISAIISGSKDKSHSSKKAVEQSTNVAEKSGNKEPAEEATVTPEFSNSGGSDSGMGLDEQSTTSTSSEESLDSTPRSVEGNNILRKEKAEDQMQSEQTAKKEPEVSFQRVTLESREKESRIPVSSTGMTDGHSNPWQSEEKKNTEIVQKLPINKNNDESTPQSNNRDSAKPEEKKDKENASVKKPSANENNGEGMPPEKQSNNRDLYKGFATGCAGLAVGCLIAGVITLGAGLFVMAAVFAIAAIVTRYLTPPSSELTSTTLSPLVDAKQR